MYSPREETEKRKVSVWGIWRLGNLFKYVILFYSFVCLFIALPSIPLDKGGRSWKKFFRPFGPQFGLKIGGRAPPGPSPGSATANWEIRHHSLVCCCVDLLTFYMFRYPPGGTPGNSLCECAARFSKSWTYIRPKGVVSTPVFRPDLQNPYPFSDLAFRQKLYYHCLE